MLGWLRRKRSFGSRWQLLLSLLAAVIVTATMVTIAQNARESADRHLRAQVLIARVRASGEQLRAIGAEAMADYLARPARHLAVNPRVVTSGFAAYNELNATLSQLRALEQGPAAVLLSKDAFAIFDTGIRALTLARAGHLQMALRAGSTQLRPEVDRLAGDARAAARREGAVAAGAASDATAAFIASLIAGIIALSLLGWRYQRLRRQASLAEQRRALESHSEQRIRALLEHSTDVVTVIDRDLRIWWQASSIKRMLGHEPAAVVGRHVTELVDPLDADRVRAFLEAASSSAGIHTLTARFLRAEGGSREVEIVADNRLGDPAVEGVVLSMRDVTERKAFEDELRHRAFHDPLTGLANRALFEDRLSRALAGAGRPGRSCAVVFFDLDDFKGVNDRLGHSRGDELLRAVALRVSGIVRPADTAARLGGDEFAILLEILDDGSQAEAVARRIADALAYPFVVGGQAVRTSASVGIAFSHGAKDLQELMWRADVAMYAAKQAGKATTRTFHPTMVQYSQERKELAEELRRGIEREQFELDYQPIVELDSGAIVGVEALVRWQHPARARLAPESFIEVAEESGAIVELGRWVLETACAKAGEWHAAFPEHQPLNISVNVSARQLQEEDFASTVREVIAAARVPAETIILEITETLLLEDPAGIVEQLRGLKALGVRVAIDDFGTGYAALSYLRHLPVDILKIDRSFVDGIEADPAKAKLARGIFNLGDSLHLDVIAEGIEKPEQAEEFRAMRLSLAQGFLFSRPLAEADLLALLADQRQTPIAALS